MTGLNALGADVGVNCRSPRTEGDGLVWFAERGRTKKPLENGGETFHDLVRRLYAGSRPLPHEVAGVYLWARGGAGQQPDSPVNRATARCDHANRHRGRTRHSPEYKFLSNRGTRQGTRRGSRRGTRRGARQGSRQSSCTYSLAEWTLIPSTWCAARLMAGVHAGRIRVGRRPGRPRRTPDQNSRIFRACCRAVCRTLSNRFLEFDSTSQIPESIPEPEVRDGSEVSLAIYLGERPKRTCLKSAVLQDDRLGVGLLRFLSS